MTDEVDADAIAEQVAIFLRVLEASGLVTAVELEILDEALQGGASIKVVQGHLLELGMLDQEQIEVVEAALQRSDRRAEAQEDLVGRLAMLKRLAREGRIDEAIELYAGLAASPVHARLAEMTLTRACRKAPDSEAASARVRKRLAELRSEEEATPAADRSSDGDGPAGSGGLDAFIALKRAASREDFAECLQLARSLRGDARYQSAAQRILQKLFLAKAVGEVRIGDKRRIIIVSVHA